MCHANQVPASALEARLLELLSGHVPAETAARVLRGALEDARDALRANGAPRDESAVRDAALGQRVERALRTLGVARARAHACRVEAEALVHGGAWGELRRVLLRVEAPRDALVARSQAAALATREQLESSQAERLAALVEQLALDALARSAPAQLALLGLRGPTGRHRGVLVTAHDGAAWTASAGELAVLRGLADRLEVVGDARGRLVVARVRVAPGAATQP